MVSILGCQRSFQTHKMTISCVLKDDSLDGLQIGKRGVEFSRQRKQAVFAEELKLPGVQSM